MFCYLIQTFNPLLKLGCSILFKYITRNVWYIMKIKKNHSSILDFIPWRFVIVTFHILYALICHFQISSPNNETVYWYNLMKTKWKRMCNKDTRSVSKRMLNISPTFGVWHVCDAHTYKQISQFLLCGMPYKVFLG